MSKPTREQFADFFNEMFEPDSKPHDPPARPVPVYVVVAEEKKSTSDQFAEWADKCLNPQKEMTAQESALAAMQKAREDYQKANKDYNEAYQTYLADLYDRQAAAIAAGKQMRLPLDPGPDGSAESKSESKPDKENAGPRSYPRP